MSLIPFLDMRFFQKLVPGVTTIIYITMIINTQLWLQQRYGYKNITKQRKLPVIAHRGKAYKQERLPVNAASCKKNSFQFTPSLNVSTTSACTVTVYRPAIHSESVIISCQDFLYRVFCCECHKSSAGTQVE